MCQLTTAGGSRRKKGNNPDIAMFLLKEHGQRLEPSIVGESLWIIKLICRRFECDVAIELLKQIFSLGISPEISVSGTIGLEYIESPSEQLRDYIKCLKNENGTPQLLKWIIRRNIRKCMGDQGLKRKIENHLPLPDALKEFLLYQDIPF